MPKWNPQQKGFAVFWNPSKKGTVLVGQHPKHEINSLASLSPYFRSGSKIALGYLNYPNVRLKNHIPDCRFFGYESLTEAKALPPSLGSFKVHGPLEVSLSRARYLNIFKKIQKKIFDGEIYQMNFAIRFRQKFSGDPYALYHRWVSKNPAAFSAFLQLGETQILSVSPERFFKVKGTRIFTEPIKGTASKAGGKKALTQLLKSEKERAELDMITDLERNDLGKISEYGSVKVLKSRAVLELPNLWHCYSVVQGTLKKSMTPELVLGALFPGGSITGCPKVRAMEMIEKFEGLPRNVFTGSLGLVRNGEMDFSIAIRTAWIRDGFIEYWAGGGIVADSDGEAEYAEALLKAERFLSIIKS